MWRWVVRAVGAVATVATVAVAVGAAVCAAAALNTVRNGTRGAGVAPMALTDRTYHTNCAQSLSLLGGTLFLLGRTCREMADKCAKAGSRRTPETALMSRKAYGLKKASRPGNNRSRA